MNGRKKIIIAAVGMFVALVLGGVAVYFGIFSKPKSGNENEVLTPPPPPPVTRTPTPENVVVPDTKTPSSSVPSNVAQPKFVVPAAHGSKVSSRGFEIQVQGGKFIPDTVQVRAGDVIGFRILAVDGNYDFTQPDYSFVKVPLAQGVEKSIQFQATATGKFTFYCESCGGPEKGPVGYLIVVPRK